MKKLDKFTLKSYIGPFVLTFFIALFVLLMQFLWKYVDDFVGKGFEWYVIAELMFYASATFVPMALPLAVLLSSLMTFGNLGENYELVAIKSAGISLQKLMRPLVFFIIVVSSGAFYFSNYILPKANLEFYTLLRDVRHKKPAVSISEGVFNSDIGEFIIKVGKKYPDGVRIEDVIIYDHSEKNGNTNVTLASYGKMEMTDDKKYLVLTLEDGVNYDESSRETSRKKRRKDKDNYPLQLTRFGKEVQRIDLSDLAFKKSDQGLMRNNYQMLNVHQLVYYEDSLSTGLDSIVDDFAVNMINDLGYYNRFYKVEGSDSLSENKYDKDSLEALPKKQFDDDIARVREASAKKGIVALARNIRKEQKPSVDKSEEIEPVKEDSFPVLKQDFIANFDSLEQVRIVVSALSNARNITYQSTNIGARIEAKSKFIARYKVEWHRKFTLSIACIILFFIGAPLGAIIRKGGLGMPLVVSILMFVLYHVFTIIGEKSVKSQVMEPWFGMWMASIIYFPVGVFLTWKATTDAPLLDAEIWLKVFKRFNIFSRFKKIKN